MSTTTVAAKTTRLQRGVRLFRERGHQIERLEIHTYAVPSCSGDETYTVYTDMGCCTCPDHRAAKKAGEACKHRVAVEVFICKRRAARRRMAS
jgi:predicted nucleic acid-binding Zn finger protein